MRIKYTYEHQYDIIRKLPLPIQAQKGGFLADVYIHFIYQLCYGECVCLLHLQMVGQR